MKKFVLIALVLVIVTAFAFAAFQTPTDSGVAFEPQQTMSFRIQPPIYTPNVGWNS